MMPSKTDRKPDLSATTLIKIEKPRRTDQSVYDFFHDFYFKTDLEGKITDISPSCPHLSGYSVEELIGRHTSDFYPIEEQRDSLIQKLSLEGNLYDYEITLRHKSGKNVPVAVSCRVINDNTGRSVGVEGVVRDISRRKRAEESLREREELMSATLESTADGILVVDANGETILTNSRFAEMWNIPEEVLRTRDDNKLLEYVLDQISDPEAFLNKVKQLYQSLTRSLDILNFKDGRVFERYSCPLIKDEKLSGRVWSFRDITSLKAAERTARESERKFKSLFNNIHDGIMAVDLDEKILLANRAASEMLGYTEEELIGRNIKTLVVPRDRAKIDRETAKRKNKEVGKYEITMIRKDGELRNIMLSATPFIDESGKVTSAVGVFSDISGYKKSEKERHDLKEKLINAQRMESLGVLAGGVAHDLNNILGPLVAYPQLIKMSLPNDSPIISRLDRIEKSAQRAAEVVQDLLTLARRGRYEMEEIDLNDIVESYLHSTDFYELSSKHDNIRIYHDIDDSIPKVYGSASHLYKIVMNLVINAIDAMPTGGDLVIKTESRDITRLAGGFSRIEPGKYDIITISDSGTGIDKNDLKRIFEPFYSKKRLGKSGSGLGLAIVYGVVKDHNGYVDVVSEKDQGSSFYVYLPAIFSETVERGRIETTDIRGNEKILIVDDVLEQRELAETVLASLGYEVATAAGGEEAIEYLKENPADLVILDMVMDPGLDGLDTYKEIIKFRPGQKAIISTGFSETDRVREAEKLGVRKVIKKPYTMQMLGKAIREMLDSGAKPPISHSRD